VIQFIGKRLRVLNFAARFLRAFLHTIVSCLPTPFKKIPARVYGRERPRRPFLSRVLSPLESSFNFFHRVFHWICEKEAGFPTVFSTFSTEFSTVLEAFRYTCCILPGGCWKLLGRNRGIFSFFQKKVEGKNLFFEAFRTEVFSASPIWNF